MKTVKFSVNGRSGTYTFLTTERAQAFVAAIVSRGGSAYVVGEGAP